MDKIKDWNRNLMGGKRPHRGIQKLGKYKTLEQRLLAESKALEDYEKRVGQHKNITNAKIVTGKGGKLIIITDKK